jgi:hypothetical protein
MTDSKYSCGCTVDRAKRGKLRNLWHRLIHRYYMFLVFYPIHSFFTTLIERVGRSLSWARFSYLNYDFDAVYLYSVMSFKLKKIQYCLENGHGTNKKEDMAALSELIAICDRLRMNEHEDKYLEKHHKKWGTLSFPFDNSKVKTPKQRKRHGEELMKCVELGERDRCADIDRMAEILKVHAPSWWD